MRLLVAGAEGQVARALLERGGAGVVALGRPRLDLARPETIAAMLDETRPDAVINAAAYTAVDRAENAREAAFAVNAAGAGALASAAQARGLPLIHVSTDYVFDGQQPAPYREDDATAPMGVYGASKLAGERAVLAAAPGAVIARTAWVYSPFGGNFVKTMLRLAETREDIGVVADQIGSPTNALDLADALLAMAARLHAAPETATRGIFHAAGAGEASWADFAEAVFAASAAAGGPSARVKRITSAEYPTPAARPANSRLDGTRLAQAYGLTLPDWRGAVAGVVARLVAEQEGT